MIVTGGRLDVALFRQEYFLGNLVLTGGAMAISIYTIQLKRYVTRFGSLLPTFLTMLAGSLLLAVFIGVVGTALPYPLFNLALRTLAGAAMVVGAVLLIQRVPVRARKRYPAS